MLLGQEDVGTCLPSLRVRIVDDNDGLVLYHALFHSILVPFVGTTQFGTVEFVGLSSWVDKVVVGTENVLLEELFEFICHR